MSTFLGSYGSILVPALIALVLVIVLVKIVIAIEHAIIRIATSLITILVLGSVLVGGYDLVKRADVIQRVAAATVGGIAPSGQDTAAPVGAATLTRSLDASARRALLGTGLNPAYLQLSVSCDGPRARMHLRYTDGAFLFGVLSGHDFVEPVPANVRC